MTVLPQQRTVGLYERHAHGLELALAADPDNLAAHSAYADWLIEQGDPRGDYIRLQLALEDRSRTREVIREMRREAYEIRSKHEHEWLGPLYDYLRQKKYLRNIEVPSSNIQLKYHRGWISSITAWNLTQSILAALIECPLIRLAKTLRVYHLAEIIGEDLSPLWNDNRLPLLVDLEIRDGNFSDVGIQHLVVSKLMFQLRSLVLIQCNITDDGALMLASHSAIPKLKLLMLDDNFISPIGAEALRSVRVYVGDQSPGMLPGYVMMPGEI